MLAIAVLREKSKKPPDLSGCGGCWEEPSFRQLAAAPELRRSSSAMVTTTTTVPAPEIDDASSGERIESIAEEAVMGSTRVLPAGGLVKPVRGSATSSSL
jgi:hypothetical protein